MSALRLALRRMGDNRACSGIGSSRLNSEDTLLEAGVEADSRFAASKPVKSQCAGSLRTTPYCEQRSAQLSSQLQRSGVLLRFF